MYHRVNTESAEVLMKWGQSRIHRFQRENKRMQTLRTQEIQSTQKEG